VGQICVGRETAAELRSRGVGPLQPPLEMYTGWAFEIADPFGNVLDVTDYVKEPTPHPHQRRPAHSPAQVGHVHGTRRNGKIPSQCARTPLSSAMDRRAGWLHSSR